MTALIPRDKLIHMAGGALVAAFAATAAFALLRFGLQPLTVFIGLSGWIAGISVEADQYNDNRTIGTHEHDVSFLDALATATPGMIAGAAFELAQRYS